MLIDKNIVYHGSHEKFDIAIPKRQRRKRRASDGNTVTVFNEISFHATAYRWIALAYTKKTPEIIWEGKKTHYTIAVNLRKYTPELELYGIGSLEDTINNMYGNGGYLHCFDAKKFHWQEGLGDLEVISKTEVKPLSVEYIEKPVDEILRENIKLKFIDVRDDETTYWEELLLGQV